MPDDSIELQVQLRPGLAFDYSDPEEDEQYLEACIRGAQDRSVGSLELAQAIRDWTSFYHLSPRRADLLRPLQHLISGDVLEVGGGCGAITRYLGETSRSVMAVEGSLRRASIMAARCRGLPNVSVHCDNFEDVPFGDRRFDAVLCIGVIEYANKFFRAENGFDRMLARMGQLLSENGVLAIAIENRLGLKYFAGAPEDHTNQLYQGIQDSYDPKSVLTLGRGEWLHRLNQQGLEPVHWFYPWPDYKTPELIVSEAALQEPGLDLSSWIRRHVHGRQDDPGAHLFSEALVWPVLARNGLAGDLANSFLLVARRAGSSVDVRFPALLWEFETERHPAYATIKQVTKSGGELQVVRSTLYPQEAPPDSALHGQENLDQELFEILNRPGWTVAQIADWANPWVESLRSRSPRETSLEFAIFQGLWSTLYTIRSCAEPAGDIPARLAGLVPLCMMQLGLDASPSALQDYISREAARRSVESGLPLDRCQRVLASEKLMVRRRPARAPMKSTFTAQLFWRAASEGYSEVASRTAKGHLESARQTISVTLPPLGATPSRPAASCANLLKRTAPDGPNSAEESSRPAASCANLLNRTAPDAPHSAEESSLPAASCANLLKRTAPDAPHSAEESSRPAASCANLLNRTAPDAPNSAEESSRPAASCANLLNRTAPDGPNSAEESSRPAAPCAISIEELRFDMSDRPGIARLHCLCLKTGDGVALWTWNGSAESLQSAQRVDASFASHGCAVVMKLFSQDPSIILPIGPQILGSLHCGASLEMELEWMDPLQYLRDLEQH